MRIALVIFSLLMAAPLMADSTTEFTVNGKSYQLAGGYAVISTINGKTQLMIAVRDTTAKAQFAITAELPQGIPNGPVELSADLHPISAVIINPKGIYSVVPQVTLSRDASMRYTMKEEIDTGELEDDPKDRPQDHLQECARGLNEKCRSLMKVHRKKKHKVRVTYKKHGPTWVGKTRAERLASGDGILRESKYKDTAFIVRLIPVMQNGKLTKLDGTFGGVVIYNEGMSPGVRLPLQKGKFSMEVHNAQ